MAPFSPRTGTPAGFTGFTLLEVMLALAIISIVLVTLHGVQARSLALLLEARFNNTAPLLAAGKLAELAVAPTLSDRGDFGEDFPGYRWQLLVSETPATDLVADRPLAEPFLRLELLVENGIPGHRYTLVWYGMAGGR